MDIETTRTERARLDFISGLMAFNSTGIGARMIEHYEDRWQYTQLIALSLGLVALVWDTVAVGPASRRALRIAMLGLVASAAVGLYLHFDSNEEFQRELDPSLAGWRLVLATMRAQSPPSLAPSFMALLGAIGWIATHGRNNTDRQRTTT